MSLKRKADELILAVDAMRLPRLMRQPGFHFQDAAAISPALAEAGLWIGPRRILEYTEQFRQIIPYVVVQVGNKIISYIRTAAGIEGRLHGRRSLGIGGHIELPDLVLDGGALDVEKTLRRGAEREVEEELGKVSVLDRKWIGIVIDDGTSVGRVHIGIVALWTIEGFQRSPERGGIGQPALISPEELDADACSLENWSGFLLPALLARTI